MNCLCCAKPLSESVSDEELRTGWHQSCIKRFFGTKKFPEIDVSEEKLIELAKESVNQGLTVPGVQKKISLHLTTGPNPRLTQVNYPTGFILKPQTSSYEFLPEAEFLAMRMAEAAGIKTVPFALVRIPKQNNRLAYITRRIDRIGNRNPEMPAMEDFCQLDRKPAQEKYHGSYERCAKIIHKYSDRPGIDMTDFYYRLLFSFVIGNSDLHLKNLSLIETAAGSQKYILSPAYDILPVNLILPEDKDQFALTMCGKTRNLRRGDFENFGANTGIPDKVSASLISRIIDQRETFIALCNDSYLLRTWQKKYAELITKRFEILSS